MRFSITLSLLLFVVCPLLAGPPRLPTPRRFPIPIRRAVPLTMTAADPAAQEALKRMLQAENSLALSGDQVTLVVRDGLDISSEQRVQRNGARALRLDYVRPARLAGEEIIDNGRFYCHLILSQDTLELSPSRVQTLRVRVPQVIQQVRSGRLVVQQMGMEVVAGHPCVVLGVMARSPGQRESQKFWVDPVNGAQLRNEQYDSAGQLRSASYYTRVTYNPAFDKAAFRIPAGGKVVMNGFASPTLTLDQVRAQAGFTVQVPTVLPDGFRYQGGSVSNRHDDKVVELRFFNGANGLSVFETPDRRGGGAVRPEHPRQGVLFGRQNGLKVVLIANLGIRDLDAALASLR